MDGPVVVPRAPSILGSVRRYALLVLVVFDLCLVAAVAFTVLVAPHPVATAQLTLDDPRGNSVFRQSNLPSADFTAYAQGRASFAQSEPVLRRAAEILGGADVADLGRRSDAEVGASSSLLEISVVGGTDTQAVDGANALTRAFLELSAEQTRAEAETALVSLETSRQAVVRASGTDPDGDSAAGRSLSETLAQLDSRAAEIRLNAALFDDGVATVQPASTAELGSTGSVLRNLVAGGLLGLLLGVALAVAVASRQRPLEDAEDAAEVLGAPLLGEIAHGRATSSLGQYEVLAGALAGAVPRGTLAVSDARPEPSSQGAALNLALALARSSPRTAVLDAAGMTGTETEGGARRTESYELPADGGPVEVRRVDASRAADVQRALAELHARFDLVVVLAPSVQEPGAANVLRVSDSVLVVVPEGELTARLTGLRQVLSLLDVPVLGYVFTRGRPPVVPVPPRTPLASAQRS